MITWIVGNTGSGKTTLARRMRGTAVLLDGTELRQVWTDLDLSEAGRREQNVRVARLAKLLESQGVDVVVATICPYVDLRKQVQEITGCRFVYLPGGKSGAAYPFEPPNFIDGEGI